MGGLLWCSRRGRINYGDEVEAWRLRRGNYNARGVQVISFPNFLFLFHDVGSYLKTAPLHNCTTALKSELKVDNPEPEETN